MPPKARKGEVDEERSQPFQAVVMADSFESHFRPFTRSKPRCLLPLCNTPLIEYTFQFLASSGVDEVFVYCGVDHADQVEEYIKNSRWSSAISPFTNLQVLHSTSRSFGDAMRDIDKRAFLTTDFLLLYGDVISNIPIQDALAAHKARRGKDKDSIMTMILRQVNTKYQEEITLGRSPFFAIVPETGRCIDYQQVGSLSKPHRFSLSRDILDYPELDLHMDLLDCGIDICTPDVLALWSDNFDYESPRTGFLHGVLKDYELNGKTIHTHIIEGSYISRVRNLQAYKKVTRDLIYRSAYPISPDGNFLESQTYRLVRDEVYAEQNINWSRSCDISGGCVIGSQTSIGENTKITGSTIGRGCKIGRNVKITNSFIWDNVEIGDNTVITDAVVANNCNIGSSCIVESNALISFRVQVPNGTTINGQSRLTIHPRGSRVPEIGAAGQEYETSDSEDEGVKIVNRPGEFSRLRAESVHSVSTFGSVDDRDMEDFSYDRHSRLSIVSIVSDDGGLGSAQRDFHHDAVASIVDSLQRGYESSNIQLELRSLRMALNASEFMVRRALVSAFSKRIVQVVAEGSTPKIAVRDVLEGHGDLFQRTVFDKKQAEKTDQIELMTEFEKYLSRQENGDSLLLYICNELYMLEVVEDTGFEQWWSRKNLPPEILDVRSKAQQFISLLLEGDSDDDDDSEDSEEDSEEESD